MRLITDLNKEISADSQATEKNMVYLNILLEILCYAG